MINRTTWRTKAAACIKAQANTRTVDDGIASFIQTLKRQAYERGYTIGTLEPPYDPVPLAIMLGAKEVRAANLGFDGHVIFEEGRLIVEHDLKTVSEERRRFTLAHEAGHLMIYKITGKISSMPAKRTAANSETERLCNKIASEILAPKVEVKAMWNQFYGGSLPKVDFIFKIGERFSISLRSAALRFQEVCLPRAGIALVNLRQKRLEWNFGVFLKSDFSSYVIDMIINETKINPSATHFAGSYNLITYEWRNLTGNRCLLVQYK
jgi:hypothetical protein